MVYRSANTRFQSPSCPDVALADYEVVAHGLLYPEGPVSMADGSLVFSEVAAGRVTQLSPDPAVPARHFETGGSPAGCAVGPDQALYICNGGGTQFKRRSGRLEPWGQTTETAVARIERIDLLNGNVSVLYEECDGRPLSSPNDLVFDAQGGFYFTDFGRTHAHHRDRGAVYYATADGSLIKQVIFPLETPNGIGLSPEQNRLYVAETITGRLWAFEVAGPGRVVTTDLRYSQGELVAGLPGLSRFDSLAVQQDGSICVATLVRGGITRVDEQGLRIEHISFPDDFTTNICFDTNSPTDAFVTLSSMGVIVKVRWNVPGLQLNYV